MPRRIHLALVLALSASFGGAMSPGHSPGQRGLDELTKRERRFDTERRAGRNEPQWMTGE